MSITTVAPPAGGFDDFKAWQTELNTDQPFTEPRVPAHESRAARKRAAGDEIAEGFAEWLRTHGGQA